MPPLDRVLEEIVSQLPGYEPRPQQRHMARVIAEAIESRRHALIEAGTGSGKSFGYLVPLIESGRKAVVATGTIALQEQLLQKDLPFLAKAYGREIRVALAKGRSNYLCLRKLEECRRTLPPGDADTPTVEQLVRLTQSGEWSGDRADLPFLVPARLWLDSLASDPEDCLGPKCPNFSITPHRLARERCEDAQIIVANHALYFTDLARGGGVLPPHDVVVFDEAHHLDRAAASALSIQIGRWMTGKLLQRIQRRFTALPSRFAEELESAERELMEGFFRRGRGQFRLEPDARLEAGAARMAASLARLAAWLERADAGQMRLLDLSPEGAAQRAETLRDQMRSVAQELALRWEHFAAVGRGARDRRASWLVVDPSRDYYELQSAPLDIGEALRHLLWGERTCILASATLAVDGRFDFLRRELGLPDDTLEAVLGSPFDYANQALLYVPREMPLPNDPAFAAAACREIERILAMTRGRAFVLCTSYRSLRELAGALVDRLPFPCKTQEDLPRSRLVEWFRQTPNAVLFATATFWEGVDIPGDALSCVIIDKLPFASPDDPVVQARTEEMKTQGEDWFGGFVLPKAILALKQGFGRLIRTRTDRGLVALLDRRVLTMRYGEVILRSLPPARRIHTLAESLEAAFAQPARAVAPPGWRRQPTVDWLEAGARSAAPPPDLDAVLGEPKE